MEDVNFVEDLEFDSILIMELLVKIEDEFDVEFIGDSDSMEAFTKLSSLTKCLKKMKFTEGEVYEG